LLKLEAKWLDVEPKSSISWSEKDEQGNNEWKAQVLPARRTVLPTADLELLWGDRSDWRQYALELERRGLWKISGTRCPEDLQAERAAPSRPLPSGEEVR
jgi:hypothetical protein